jgi:cytochrome P450
VAINAYVIHLDEGIFGRDPKSFRPERWLEGDAKVMDRYMFQVSFSLSFWRRFSSPRWPQKLTSVCSNLIQFGSGSRTCTGKNIAIMELQKVVPEILRRYDVALTDPNKSWKTINHFFMKQLGLNVVLTEREKSVKVEA